MIGKILIANRGEIAVRIARTCREMGIRTVGVFSEADRNAFHVQQMDEAHFIGAAPSSESYLRQEKILDVAKITCADAIHPGYGFLSENAEFAQAVADAGLIWIGPPASAIRAMGSKTSARDLMTKSGVPVVPGTHSALSNFLNALNFAETAGYPILLKAAAGGGGKGMRVVNTQPEMKAAFESAQREAQAAFGDSAVYAEKYLERPRHIEIQVFADKHGNAIHLGERECSLQRRHQKIIEESPSIAVSPDLRQRMGETAVRAAKACGYVGAGTIECLLDEAGNYYFLEMNTRLQVEHAVTECVTNLDLVRLQILVANGGRLPFSQDEIKLRGHAIEVRVYAEDVLGGFLPSTGILKRFRSPSGPGIREDSGFREGDEISRYYDPMISKLIVSAESREAARQRAVRALMEYEVAGVRTNIPFCRHILSTEAFAKGAFHTRSADMELFKSYQDEQEDPVQNEILLAAAIARVISSDVSRLSVHSNHSNGAVSQWKSIGRKTTLEHRERQ
jgi:propionyl-CoA carboxylase alpha chain